MSDWRIEALNLASGLRKVILQPSSFSFEEKLNEVGSGSVTVPLKSVKIADVWPHTTSIAFLRTAGPDATPSQPVCEFIGMVEDFSADANGGAVSLGVNSIESYWAHRIIHGDQTFSAMEQNTLAYNLARTTTGIPLEPQTGMLGSTNRDRTYLDTDHKILLDALLELTQVLGGPDYRLEHVFQSDNSWKTYMRFQDQWGNTTTPYTVIDAQRSVGQYGLQVSAGNHATSVIGVGATADLVDTENASPSIYPLFEVAESYSDVSDINTVTQKAQGSLAQNKHPAATPSVTLTGLDMIAPLALGDYITLKMSTGPIQYQGTARITGIAWAFGESTPTTATVSLVPQDDAGTAILGAP